MLKSTTGRASSLGITLLKGLLWATGWTVLSSLAVAWMVSREWLRLEQTGYASGLILLVCGMLIARAGTAGGEKEKLTAAAVGTGLFFLCLLLVNWMFFGGKTEGFGVTLLVLCLGTALGSLRSRRGRGGVSRRRYKIPKG